MSPADRERLDDLLVSFRRDLRAADRSPRALVLYARTVDRFASWLVDRGREPVLAEFTKAGIGAHLGEMLDRARPRPWRCTTAGSSGSPAGWSRRTTCPLT